MSLYKEIGKLVDNFIDNGIFKDWDRNHMLTFVQSIPMSLIGGALIGTIFDTLVIDTEGFMFMAICFGLLIGSIILIKLDVRENKRND